MSQYAPKFWKEYICLKCGHLQDERGENCPRCGGSMCPRIVRVWA